jgi:hypothetical protein
MAAQYVARAGTVYVSQLCPVTPEKAAFMAAIHRRNADYWQTREDLSALARRRMAEIEIGLAEEMDAAIAEALRPMMRAA